MTGGYVRSMPRAAPQPIPYQGSKRLQVPVILGLLPADLDTLHEPFVGSGAVTIGAAIAGRARRYVVGDSLAPLVGVWRLLLEAPDDLADGYEALWLAQRPDPRAFYDRVRDDFNATGDPARLLYLLARCVKNAVRFNRDGRFNQSADHRRLGVRPGVLRARAREVHAALAGRAQARVADYADALAEAGPADVVYLDPPYAGTSGARDTRYHQGLALDRFVADLRAANARGVSYLVSFDGRSGDRTYGPGLPDHLDLERLEVPVGRSSQATLSGRVAETVESLYLSAALRARLGRRG